MPAQEALRETCLTSDALEVVGDQCELGVGARVGSRLSKLVDQTRDDGDLSHSTTGHERSDNDCPAAVVVEDPRYLALAFSKTELPKVPSRCVGRCHVDRVEGGRTRSCPDHGR